MDVRMFRPHATRKTDAVTTRMHATQANAVAGNARVRAFRPCPVSTGVAMWSPISLETTGHDGHKYGRPRRHEVSHP
jgi:hypothetical protein